MNEAFRQYAFGRAFNLQLSERHIVLLALIAKGDTVASLGLDHAKSGLLRRGLVEWQIDNSPHAKLRVTKAGLLVYDLLVEAGEFAALEEKRRQLVEMETELQRAEFEERFGRIEIKFKDRFSRDAEPAQ